MKIQLKKNSYSIAQLFNNRKISIIGRLCQVGRYQVMEVGVMTRRVTRDYVNKPKDLRICDVFSRAWKLTDYEFENIIITLFLF